MRQEVQGETALLKPARPEAANLGETRVHVAFHELHAQFAGFEHAEGQKVLNEVLQALSAGKHVAHHFALAVIQRSEFLALQQFNVAVQDRQGRLEVVGGRGESVRGLAKTVTQLFELAYNIGGRAGRGYSRRAGWRQAVFRTRASGGSGWAFVGHRSHGEPN